MPCSRVTTLALSTDKSSEILTNSQLVSTIIHRHRRRGRVGKSREKRACVPQGAIQTLYYKSDSLTQAHLALQAKIAAEPGMLDLLKTMALQVGLAPISTHLNCPKCLSLALSSDYTNASRARARRGRERRQCGTTFRDRPRRRRRCSLPTCQPRSCRS